MFKNSTNLAEVIPCGYSKSYTHAAKCRQHKLKPADKGVESPKIAAVRIILSLLFLKVML